MISALVSQSKGLAVFDDGERAAALLDAESEPRVLTERELSRLLRGAHDIEALVLPGLPELRVVLHDRRLREQVLHATLLLIDGQSSMSLRTTAGTTLIGLAAPDAIVRWVGCVLMSVPAPVEADFGTVGALPCDERIKALLHRVQLHQSRIRSVFASFVAVCRKRGEGDWSPVRRRAVAEGWFRALVLGERLVLGESDDAWGLVQEWIATLTEMMSGHAIIVRPAFVAEASSRSSEHPSDAGWVIWPLSPAVDLSIPDRSSSSVLTDVYLASQACSPLLLEDLNLRRAERRLCEAALARVGTIDEAARLLGITHHALERRLAKHRIQWPDMGSTSAPGGAMASIAAQKGEVAGRRRRIRARRFEFVRPPKSKSVDED
jgi:Bacterial regulatory protein, Fis family